MRQSRVALSLLLRSERTRPPRNFQSHLISMTWRFIDVAIVWLKRRGIQVLFLNGKSSGRSARFFITPRLYG